MASLESLPSELLLKILSFLEAPEIASFQQVSKNLLQLCRDNTLWLDRCFDDSGWVDDFYGRRALFVPDTTQLPANPVPATKDGQEKERARLKANWDPFYPTEKPQWYTEYIHRKGPISVNWYQQANWSDPSRYSLDARGVALYYPSSDRASTIAVSPMEDASVCLWDVKGTRGKRGAILSRSVPGSLFFEGKGRGRKSELLATGVVESITIDSERDQAFVAIENHLTQVDLRTLQTVNCHSFPWVIGSLSTVQPGVPITVGTNLGIHLYDHRVMSTPRDNRDEQVEVKSSLYKSLRTLFDDEPLPPYTPLPQPGPLSILHLENPGAFGSVSDHIYVAGRFSNILHYDRRAFPRIMNTIHSGAQLCTMTSLPFSFSALDSALRREGQLSLDQVQQSKSITEGRTIIAAGAYNTKGALELYGIEPDIPPPTGSLHRQGDEQKAVMKNRQTVSGSKVLSVVNHGSRIAFSDGSGFVKWFERDGRTEVRRTRIGHTYQDMKNSLFASMPGSDDIARKLLATSRTPDEAGTNDNDILFWTGEKLGAIRFSSRPGTLPPEFEEVTKTTKEQELEEKAELHGAMMRRALEAHAFEVRRLRGLGNQR